MRLDESFGGILRAFRTMSLRESTRQFAPRVGLSHGHLSAIERGTTEPSRQMVEKVSEVLEFDLDVLLGSAGMVRKEYGGAIVSAPNAVVTLLQLLSAAPRSAGDRFDRVVAQARKKHHLESGEIRIDADTIEALAATFAEALMKMAREVKTMG